MREEKTILRLLCNELKLILDHNYITINVLYQNYSPNKTVFLAPDIHIDTKTNHLTCSLVWDKKILFLCIL